MEEVKSQWGKTACTKKANFYLKHAVGKILDYGCGYGSYGLYMKSKGFAVVFADVDPEFLKSIACDAKDKVLVRDLDSFPFRDNEFNTLLLGDVIEHVEDLPAFWKEATRITSDAILVSVPRRETPRIVKLMGMTWRAYEDPTHKRYFEPADLKHLINAKFDTCEVLKYYPRKRLDILFNALEWIGFFPGYLATYKSR